MPPALYSAPAVTGRTSCAGAGEAKGAVESTRNRAAGFIVDPEKTGGRRVEGTRRRVF
jgi:hypothetical protein